MIKSLYISQRWFFAFAFCVIFIVLGYYLNVLFIIGQFALLLLFVLTLLDTFLLFAQKQPIVAERKTPARLNLGDESNIELVVKSQSNYPLSITVYDEPPIEMQARSLKFKFSLKGKQQHRVDYQFFPARRGQYEWKNIHLFLSSFLGLLDRKIIVNAAQQLDVYPSVLQMRKFEFLMFNQQTAQRGIKKIRRLGHNQEFEQIKNYVQGDDIRTINWKATSRTSSLMVNQYQDQRSQSVYAIIDKSRSMEHQFEGLTLLDYAINSTLVFSNIALRKGDKMGLISFTHKLGTTLPASMGKKQLQFILDALYNQRTEFKEANFSLLYQHLRRTVTSRALLILYTNFETELAMKRALPMLKRLNKRHVLVVVFFKNTDLGKQVIDVPNSARDIYVSTIAEDVMNIKKRIALELNQSGIQTILTDPTDLNINTINKYLELKSKGLI